MARLCDGFSRYGKSGRVADHYQIVDYRRDIITFLQGHFTEPAVLIGHSLGAMTAIAVAAQVPERVRAIVLLDPPLFLRDSPLVAMVSAQNWFGWVYETLKLSSSYEDVLVRCRAHEPNIDDAALNEMAGDIYRLDIGTVAVTLQDQLLAGWDLELALHSITCPTLLMRGDWDHDAAVRDDDAAYVQANLPQVVDVKIPNATHLFPWEQTDITNQHVQRFLQSV